MIRRIGERENVRIRNLCRFCKKNSFLHMIVIFVVLSFFIAKYFVPKYILPHMPFLQIHSDIHALMYFDVHNDASKITWSRATNSEAALEKAIKSNVDMIEGDVILQGQGSQHQSLIPLMQQIPQPSSDLKLVDWLERLKFVKKGFKLDFSTIAALEISLQRLKEFDKQNPMQHPVWIHANVLIGPHGGPVMVDPTRFILTIMREFPRCTVSLGWTTGTHTDLSQSGYSWDMVMDMRQLVKKWHIDDQPIVFEARLSLIRNSVPQLKWLIDNTAHSALNVVHVKDDRVYNEDIMYLAYRFSPESVFFDLDHEEMDSMLKKYRHFSQGHIHPLVSNRDDVVVKPEAWVKMGFHMQHDSIMPSTEALVLTSPLVYIVSKIHYRPSPEIYMQGRVLFLNRNNDESEMFSTGLIVYLRSSAFASFDDIVGVQCFLGVDGDIEVSSSNMRDTVPAFRKTARITPSAVRCFRFWITDTSLQIIFQISVVHECHTLRSVAEENEPQLTLSVDIPNSVSRQPSPFILRTKDNQRQVVVDELSIKQKT